MPLYPDLYILRHGQTEWNVAGRYQGRRDSPLTATGLAQATAQAKILGKALAGQMPACFMSPQGRAVKTAKIALAELGIQPVPDSRLQEVDFGDWEGLTRAEIDAEKRTGNADLHWHFSAPNGERMADMKHRVQGFLQSLQAPSIVVTHGITSIVLRGLWLGHTEAAFMRLPHNQGCVYHLANAKETCLTE